MDIYIAPWKKTFLTGRCYDFALALAEQLDDPIFVAIGDERFPSHVGLKVAGGYFADIRGILDEDLFLAHFRGSPISQISRDTVELHCGVAGMKPPYKGNKDIQDARRAVRQAYPDGVLTALDAVLAPVGFRR